MTGPEEREMLRQRRLAFIGQVLTAFTRKIPHHSDTLQGSARRLAHLLKQINQESLQDKQKLAQLLSAIERHLMIFRQKTQNFDRFGKRMGMLPCRFNPVEVVEEAIIFSTRLAHLQKVSLKLEVDEALPSLYSDPVRFHFLVSIAIHSMLERLGEGGKVLVRIGSSEKKLLIRVTGHGTFGPIAPSEPKAGDLYWPIGQQMAANLGVHVEPADIERDTELISLFLPVEQDFKKF
jgi:signal transduction histidine kinase